MAHAHTNVWSKRATVKVECTDEIAITCGDCTIKMDRAEAQRLCNELAGVLDKSDVPAEAAA